MSTILVYVFICLRLSSIIYYLLCSEGHHCVPKSWQQGIYYTPREIRVIRSVTFFRQPHFLHTNVNYVCTSLHITVFRSFLVTYIYIVCRGFRKLLWRDTWFAALVSRKNIQGEYKHAIVAYAWVYSENEED